MKIAIYGAGSLGTILGAYIAKGNVNIDLISRNREHIKTLKEKGAHIVGTVDFYQKVNALYIEEMKEKYEIIFLMTKQLENDKVVTFLKDYLTKDGTIVTLQNGLPEILIANIVGKEHVLGCTVSWGATLKEPGVSELTSSPDSLTFSLGSLVKDNPKILKVKYLLELMGNVEINDNFLGVRWSKLLINAAFSGMSACLGVTFGEASKNKQSRRVIQRIIKECLDVAEGNNIKIEPVQGKDIAKLMNYHNKIKKAIAFMIIPLAIKKHRLLKASMLQDIEKDKKCEVMAINGVVCSEGKKVNIPTPFNDKVVEIIKYIEEKKLTPSTNNIILFNEILK